MLVSNRAGNTISKIDLQTLAVVDQYPAPGGPDCMDLLADGMIGLNVLLAARWMQHGFAEPIDKVVRTNLLPYQGLMHLAKHNSTATG